MRRNVLGALGQKMTTLQRVLMLDYATGSSKAFDGGARRLLASRPHSCAPSIIPPLTKLLLIQNIDVVRKYH